MSTAERDIPSPVQDPKNRPDWSSPQREAMLRDLTVCRDVAQGTGHIRDQGTKYLPQHPAEETIDYRIRLNRSILFNGFERTIRGLSGMVFRRDPEAGEDVPDAIRDHFEDIDRQGTHLDVFAKTVFEDALEAGHCGILVDAPRVSADRELTLADERLLGVRPHWVHVRKEDIYSWRSVNLNGQVTLLQIAVREVDEEPVGVFATESVERYRVYSLNLETDPPSVQWFLFRKTKGDNIIAEGEGIIANVDRIPFIPIYGKKVALLESAPPLVDLAYTNLAHWQVQSDHFHALHIASVPLLLMTGVDPKDPIKVGPNSAISLPDVQSDAKYIEHGGAALGASRQQLQDLKTEMAILGLSMLQHETRAAETAEAKRIDKSEQDSQLATAARSLQDGLENALFFHAQMMKLDSGGSLTVNRDFEKLSLDAAQILAYSGLVEKGQLSLNTLWTILAEGGVLPDNFDPEMERDRVEIPILPGEDE